MYENSLLRLPMHVTVQRSPYERVKYTLRNNNTKIELSVSS